MFCQRWWKVFGLTTHSPAESLVFFTLDSYSQVWMLRPDTALFTTVASLADAVASLAGAQSGLSADAGPANASSGRTVSTARVRTRFLTVVSRRQGVSDVDDYDSNAPMSGLPW